MALELSRRAGRLTRRFRRRNISSIDDYAAMLNSFVYNGTQYGYNGYGPTVQQSIGYEAAEPPPIDLTSYTQNAYQANGIVFALMATRMLVFSAVRFNYQRINKGRPSALFSNANLAIVERPWVGGTTQDLLVRMITDVDLAGNSYWVRVGNELVRLRPDWVNIVLAPRLINGERVGYRKVGYAYYENGQFSGVDPVIFLPEEVCHFAPYPDPLANYRGMSWITPVIRELQNDKLMTRHQRKFFENGATPNLVVSVDASVKEENFKRLKKLMEQGHEGVENAYKTLYLGGGADVTVVGNSFEQMSFKTVQGAGETRMAAAAGVPPVIAGFSEGLQSATYSNYAQARRRFADGTMHPLWQSVAGALEQVVGLPGVAGQGVRFWYDSRDVPFLREDRMDAANIQNKQANSISQLVTAGYTADTVIEAVTAEDWALLEHSGLFSVQLQPPVDPNEKPSDPQAEKPADPEAEDAPDDKKNDGPPSGGNAK